jgi:DNA-binding response OmpR family regulator
MTTILIAEDDELQAELVRRYLEREGYDTVSATDGTTALELARAAAPDLIVLDLMLPGTDGFSVCRALRAEGADMPIVMLTARDTEDDMLTGLELGADDYLSKPYSPRELVTRVRVLLRRRTPPTDRTLSVGPIVIDAARHDVQAHGRPVSLTPGEFQLLTVLAENAGLVLTRAQLLQHLHGSDRFMTERTIDTHMRNIRAKIEEDPRSPRLLRTVYGVGYTLADGRVG